jgi:subtilisin family serine protease
MLGEEYADLIIYYLNSPERLNRYKDSTIHYINEMFATVHIPVTQITARTLTTFGYSTIPKLYGLTSEVSLEASGVDRIRNTSYLNLRGSGVLVGIIDTGIDYSNPVFIKEDGTSKIASLWDQTIDSETHPYATYFGTEYRTEQINIALASENPLELVPSVDENGHGTMMAAVATGNENSGADFSGVVPDADLVIVKLQQAKQYLRNFYLVPEDTICFQENYIMWGVQYCIQYAKEVNRPIVICLGIGSSQGAHDGRSPLSAFLSVIGDYPLIAVVTSAGNESNLGRHYYNVIDPSIGYNTVELNIGENDRGFSMELWGDSPGIYSIDILSPNREYIPVITARLRVSEEISFIFDTTRINIDYLLTESETGDQLIMLRFRNVAAGVWKFNVYGQGNLPASFHIWLPMGTMISEETRFLQPDIYTTVLAPGSADVPLTITAYQPVNNSLYINSSRGFTRNNTVKPELAAPGVNYVAPNLNKEFVSYTGTGVAAAHAAGIVAMILEWGIVRGNQPGLDTVEIKNYLFRSAKRNPNTAYPNRDWGYGIIDIYNVFRVLRSDFGE